MSSNTIRSPKIFQARGKWDILANNCLNIAMNRSPELLYLGAAPYHMDQCTIIFLAPPTPRILSQPYSVQPGGGPMETFFSLYF